MQFLSGNFSPLTRKAKKKVRGAKGPIGGSSNTDLIPRSHRVLHKRCTSVNYRTQTEHMEIHLLLGADFPFHSSIVFLCSLGEDLAVTFGSKDLEEQRLLCSFCFRSTTAGVAFIIIIINLMQSQVPSTPGVNSKGE